MIVRLATSAMGTRFELVLGGDDAGHLRAAGEAALDEIRDQHQRLSIFDRGSLLSHVNAHAARAAVRVDDDLFELLQQCAAIATASDGAFDPTVGPAMHAWGFRGDAAAASTDVADAHIGMDGVELDPARRTVRFQRHGMALDLGGIAKGYALDLAAVVLREHDIACALLHGGTSSVIAIGAPPDQPEGWRIQIADAADTTVTLRDAALGVSAPHGRTVGESGHVIDPRTGRPTAGTRLAAVVAPTALDADAWATALVVLGRVPGTVPDDLTTFIVRDDATGPETGGASPRAFARVATAALAS